MLRKQLNLPCYSGDLGKFQGLFPRLSGRVAVVKSRSVYWHALDHLDAPQEQQDQDDDQH